MDRFEFEDLISAYIEHDLPLNKKKEVEAYLSENPSHNQLVKKISDNMVALQKLPKIVAKDNFNDKLMEKIKSNNYDLSVGTTKKGNILGFTFFNASILLGLIFFLFILSFEITGLSPISKNNQSPHFTSNNKLLGKNDIIEKNKKEDDLDLNLTTLQNDTTKKEKIDYSKNIKYVND